MAFAEARAGSAQKKQSPRVEFLRDQPPRLFSVILPGCFGGGPRAPNTHGYGDDFCTGFLTQTRDAGQVPQLGIPTCWGTALQAKQTAVIIYCLAEFDCEFSIVVALNFGSSGPISLRCTPSARPPVLKLMVAERGANYPQVPDVGDLRAWRSAS